MEPGWAGCRLLHARLLVHHWRVTETDVGFGTLNASVHEGTLVDKVPAWYRPQGTIVLGQ